MTAKKELSADKSTGSACRFEILSTNVLATSEVRAKLSVRPYGYARYITVELGFTAVISK